MSTDAVPIVVEACVEAGQLQEAFDSWYKRGQEDLAAGKHEEAVACFQEALHRLPTPPLARQAELKVRTSLVAALKRSQKLAEAAQQCLLISALYAGEPQQLQWKNQAEELYKQNDVMQPSEGKAALLKSAAVKFPQGKQKITAALFAIVLGGFGAHKFYLGQRDAGLLTCLWVAICLILLYLSYPLQLAWLESGLWFLLFAPWIVAMFEALNYLQMSPVTFNLSYNIEQVLASIPAEMESPAHDADLFSMEITDDPEDYIDELSTPRANG